MRAKRSKQYRKLMHQYGVHFGFREPYQVLVDAEVLQDASRFKMDFATGLRKVLHGDVKLMITQCCIRHLYDADPKDENLIQHAKAFDRRLCNHQDLEKPLSGFECIASVLDPKESRTNKHRYIVATQDESLRSYLRSIPGVPLIYIKRSVMIMEPMTAVTEQITRKGELLKFKAGLKSEKAASRASRNNDSIIGNNQDNIIGGQSRIQAMSTALDSEQVPLKKKRKRGPSGPNPLSVRKPKTRSGKIEPTKRLEKLSEYNRSNDSSRQDEHDGSDKKRRKRKHGSNKANDAMNLAEISPPLNSLVESD